MKRSQCDEVIKGEIAEHACIFQTILRYRPEPTAPVSTYVYPHTGKGPD